MRVGSEAPVWTGTDFGVPFWSTVTVLPAAVVWTALVGTVSTWTTWLMTMLAEAEIPGRIELLASVS